MVPPNLGEILDIAAGEFHTAAVLRDGRVVAWGSNGYGDLTAPPQIPVARSIVAGGRRSIALFGDWCPNNPLKDAPAVCGCNVPDTDSDGDALADCLDNCVAIANPSQADCDGDGIGDACEIADGASDCNANGRPDSCDIADATAPDCNANGVPDACDIATGGFFDCDEDGRPDVCEGAVRIVRTSGWLGPVGFGAPVSTTLGELLPAYAEIPPLRLEIRADLGAQSEYIGVIIDDLPPIFVFVEDGFDCPAVAESIDLSIDGPDFAAIIADGAITVTIAPSGPVSVEECTGSAVRISLDYHGLPPASDCDGNGALDSCETGNGWVEDCNENNRPDMCDLAGGSPLDCNGNLLFDSCDISSGRSTATACPTSASSLSEGRDTRPSKLRSTLRRMGP